MKSITLKIISYLALAGTIIPSLMVFFGDMDLQLNKNIMVITPITVQNGAPPRIK